MLSINNLSYFISGTPLYEGASLHVRPKDKIGLIGLNGKGKTTLLRIIHGDIQPDSGTIEKANDCTIGFLNQDLLSYQSDDSILTVAMEAFREAVDIQRQIEATLSQMETDYSDKLLNRLTRLQEEFERLDGYSMQARAEEILEGIGFCTDQLQRPLREFSGGWRMRVMLARLLLEKPALLLLDEPTNHLDLPSIRWVENYLKNYEGAVIVVSHDRTFLNNTVTRIVEVANKTLTLYEGNYDFYVKEKELRTEIQKNAYENQQQHIRQTERFIERFKAKATKARQVQSRIKALNRMERIEEVADDTAVVNFRFRFNKQSGRHVVTLKNVSKAFGELKILENTDAQIMRGDKIALIGANGLGKSTLLRIIAGQETVQGTVETGYNVITAFYAQHQLEALTLNNEILDELRQSGSGKTDQELRNILGCFLFTGDDVFKKIKVLSGGEKSRVALAKTLISEANFLMLDEPTNHLDMISENILIQALQQYEGTFVVVSHNRHFINQVANKIWYIEDRKIKEYPGTFEEYEYWLGKQEKAGLETAKTNQPPMTRPAKKPINNDKTREAKALHQQLNRLEESIQQLEEQKATVEEQLSEPANYGNPDRLAELSSRFDQLEKELANLQADWDDLAGQIDAMESGR